MTNNICYLVSLNSDIDVCRDILCVEGEYFILTRFFFLSLLYIHLSCELRDLLNHEKTFQFKRLTDTQIQWQQSGAATDEQSG